MLSVRKMEKEAGSSLGSRIKDVADRVFDWIHDKLRSPPCAIGTVLLSGTIGGAIPDFIDHGFIFEGREAHLPIAVFGLGLSLLSLAWLIYVLSLHSGHLLDILEMVK